MTIRCNYFVIYFKAWAINDELVNQRLKTHETLEINDFQFNVYTKVKRDLSTNDIFLNTNELKFNAYGRLFHIYLKRQTNLISNTIKIEVKYANQSKAIKLHDFITKNYYVGFVDNEPNSFVSLYFDRGGSLEQGDSIVFGKIESNSETYYIEVICNRITMRINNSEVFFLIYLMFKAIIDEQRSVHHLPDPWCPIRIV